MFRSAIRASRRKASRSFSTGRMLSSDNTPSQTAQKWTRPLEPGVVPAYDEALAYIERDAAQKRAKLEILREEKDSIVSPEVLERLEIDSEINLPEVRWNFTNNRMDLSKPVYRHLLNKRWREKGRLDRLMERIYQMHVVPDLLPYIRPNVDIRVDFSALPPSQIPIPKDIAVPEKKLAQSFSDVEPGLFLSPRQTINSPTLTAQVFHPESRLYTLLMIDPDVPSPATHSFQNYLHWLVPNIPLSATSSSITISPSTSGSIPYIPPHPQYGTPYHRYTLLLLPQPKSGAPIAASYFGSVQRLGFDVRAFVKEHGLLVQKDESGSVEEGGGIFMWRGIWDSSVTAIYQEILKLDEPKFGRPPKFDPYVDENGERPKKYASVSSVPLQSIGEEAPATQSRASL